MVVIERTIHHTTYCSCCSRHFTSRDTPRHVNAVVPLSSVCQDEMEKVRHEDSVDGPNWTSAVRPDVKLASRVHYVTCRSCKSRHRNPPSDYLYTEKKTTDVIECGALLRLMGDLFQHRYSNDHR